MKVTQSIIRKDGQGTKIEIDSGSGFVLVFGERHMLDEPSWRKQIENPSGKDIVYVSTAGEINNNGIEDDTILINDLSFENTELKLNNYNLSEHLDSLEIGKSIYEDIDKENLKYVLLFMDSEVNGDYVLEGFDQENQDKIPVMGGIAGDGRLFEKTIVGLNDHSDMGEVVAVCFYGSSIRINHGFAGGWWEFGPIKKVTKSNENVVSEINGQPALEVFKKYLGSEVDNLPASALRFPLQIDENRLVRTILDIDEETNSMIFAGNIDQSTNVKMLNANKDDLMEASCLISQKLASENTVTEESFVLAISCAGRKWVYEERADDEYGSIRKWYPNATIAGFFSYGEICPVENKNLLHNQTLTLLDIYEV